MWCMWPDLPPINRVRKIGCFKCKKKLLPVAVIFNDLELIRLLKHFGLPADFPRFLPVPREIACKYPRRANGPPNDGCRIAGNLITREVPAWEGGDIYLKIH